ncbi:MAG TPA: type II secretion system F family protein [Candidatus Paceibacterota bacterium]
MAKFKYQARTKTGELQVGSVEALNHNEAVSILSGHELFILSLEELGRRELLGQLFDYLNRVKSKDMMIFTRQFATLLSARVPLSDALGTLRNQTTNETLRNVIGEIAADVDAGLSLSQSLAKYNRVFSDFYVNMVRSAEVTGSLDESVNFLADYVEKQVNLAARIKGALIYPVVLLGLFFIVAGVMVVVVFPQIGPIFEEAGVEVPAFTRVLLAGGEFLASWWWAIFLALGLLAFWGVNYFRTAEGKTFRDEIILRTPVINHLLKQLYIARLSESLGVLIKGGIPIAQAIEITGATVGSAAYGEAFQEVANEVRQGELLSRSLGARSQLFPPLVSQMVAIGENTGRLDELLGRVSSFYTREVETSVNQLVELIQPLLLVVVGLLVGGLFASILIPIYNLAQTF